VKDVPAHGRGLAWMTGRMASMTGVLEWKHTGSLGRTLREDEEGVSLSVSKTSWSAWGWMSSRPRSCESGLKVGQGRDW